MKKRQKTRKKLLKEGLAPKKNQKSFGLRSDRVYSSKAELHRNGTAGVKARGGGNTDFYQWVGKFHGQSLTLKGES